MRRLPILLVAAAPAAATAQSPPRVLPVPGRFPTIQAGIDSSRNGDTVLVAPGRYRENIRFNGKSIVLASRFARTRDPGDIIATIIDGGGSSRPDSASAVMIVDREDSTTVLEGFTILGGTGTAARDVAGRIDFREGGAVLCDVASPTIRFNRIIGNLAVAPVDSGRRLRSSGGGGIRCAVAEPVIEGNLFRANRGRYGAGLVLYHSNSVVRHNLFVENTGGEEFGGGGAWIVADLSRRVTTVVSDNTFAANVVLPGNRRPDGTPAVGGGGAVVGGVTATITRNRFVANQQPTGGPLLVRGGRISEEGNAEITAADWRAAVLAAGPHGALAGADSARFAPVLRALLAAPDPAEATRLLVDLRARRAELLATDREAGRAGQPIGAGLAQALANDAVMIGPRGVLWRGPAEVAAGTARDPAGPGARIGWQPARVDVSADGTHGYSYGYLTVARPAAGPAEWKYLAYWRRDPDDRWRVVAYKRLPAPAGPPSAAAPLAFQSPGNDRGTWFPTGPSELSRLFALDSAFSRDAAARGAAAAFERFTAPDGATLGSGPAIAWGPTAVAAEFKSFGPGTIEWAPDDGLIAPSGDLAFATGMVTFRERRPDGTVVEVGRGRYLTIWKRQADGSWRLIIDG